MLIKFNIKQKFAEKKFISWIINYDQNNIKLIYQAYVFYI